MATAQRRSMSNLCREWLNRYRLRARSRVAKRWNEETAMRKHGIVQYTIVGLRLQPRIGTPDFCGRKQIVRCLLVSACLAACLGSSAFDARAQTQSPAVAPALPSTSTLPSSRVELADQDPDYWTLKKFPSQQYMHEIYW